MISNIITNMKLMIKWGRLALILMLCFFLGQLEEGLNSFDSDELRRLGHFHCYQKDFACIDSMTQCIYLPTACPEKTCSAAESIGFYDSAKELGGNCDPKVSCCGDGSSSGAVLYTLVPGWSFSLTQTLNSGSYTITSAYTEVMTYTANAFWSQLCPHVVCRIFHESGSDATSCITYVNDVTGNFALNTAGCTIFGPGTYSYMCTGSRPWYDNSNNNSDACYFKSNTFTMTVNDICDTPQVISSLNPADYLANEQYLPQPSQIVSNTVPISSFISLGMVNSCALSNCQLVKASDASTCTTNTGTGFVTGTVTGANIKIDISTVNQKTLEHFCLECTDNNQTPRKHYSQPFGVEVIPINCNSYITITPLPQTTYTYEVAAAGPHNVNSIRPMSSWVTSSQPVACPLNNFRIMKSDGSGPYTGSLVQITSTSDGSIFYDSGQFGTASVYVEFKSAYNTVYRSSDFTVINNCKPITLNTVNNFAFDVPPTSPQALQTVTDASTYISNGPLSDNAVCPRTYTLRNTDGSSHSSTLLDYASQPVLRVETDMKDSKTVKFRITQQGIDYDTNAFTVSVACGSTSYSLNDHSPTTNPVVYQIDQNQPTHPINYITPVQPLCAPQQYDFFDSMSGGNSPPTGLLPGTVNAITTPSPNVVATDYYAKTTYPFYIRVTIEGGQQIWATIGGSNMFQLQVVCGPLSTMVSEGTFGTGYSQTQYTRKGMGQCFILPSYISSLAACPINLLQSSTNSGGVTNPGSNFVLDPVETAPGSGIYQVCPHNDNADQDIDFYVKFTAEGGANSFSQKYRLVHGCPPGVYTITSQPTFQNWVKHVSIAKEDIWTQNGDYAIHPTDCAVQSFELDYKKFNGLVSFGAVNYAASCGAAVPCKKLDLVWNDFPHTVNFRYKYTLPSGEVFYTPDVQIDLICTSASTVITPSFSTDQVFEYEQYTLGNNFSFGHFSCTPVACCNKMKYYLNTDNQGTDVNQSSIHGPLFTSVSGLYVNNIFTGDMASYDLYIMAIDNGGNIQYSPKITINVKYNCRFDKIYINSDGLTNKENPPPELAFISQNRYNVNPNLHLNLSTNQDGNRHIDITGRFVHNASHYCPIKNYWVYKIRDAQTGLFIMPKNFDEYLSTSARLNSLSELKGWLDLFKQNNPYSVYVYVNVSTDYNYLHQPDPLVLVTLTEPYRPPPNYAPFFEDGALDNLSVNVTITGERLIEQILLPPVQDSYSSERHFIWIEDLPPYMTIDQSNRIIYIDRDRFPRDQLGTQTFDLTLYDKGGLSTKYRLNIEFYEDLQVAPVVQKHALIQLDPQYSYNGQNVSAYIHSISIYGEMEIRFNASMFTDFNFSWFNESFVDIYMIPNDPELDINITRWNFTWNLTYFEDNIMRIQLNFSDPKAISQKIDQDRIVFHVLNNQSQALFSAETGTYLHHNFWTLKSRVRKQLDLIWKDWMDWEESAVSWMRYLLLISLAFMYLFDSFGFSYYMWYLRSLQLVVHLPMVYIVCPANVCRYFELVKPIVTFDLLPSEEIRDFIFSFDYAKQREFQEELLDQMEDLGYQTHNSICILGSLWIYIALWLGKVGFYFAYKFINVTWFQGEKVASLEGGSGDLNLDRYSAMAQNIKSKIKSDYDKGLAKLEQTTLKDKNQELTQTEKKFIDYYGDSDEVHQTKKKEKPKKKKVKSDPNQDYMNNGVHEQESLIDFHYYGSVCKTKCSSFCCGKKAQKFVYSFAKSLFWGTILMILIEPYMEFAIAGIMNMKHMASTSASDEFSNVTGFFTIILAFSIIPGVFILAYSVDPKKYRSKKHTAKFGMIFYDIKHWSNIYAWYIGIMTARRLLFIVICFSFRYFAGAQMMCILYLNLAFVIYLGVKPMQTRFLNWLHFLEEMVVQACTVHMLCFLWAPAEQTDIGYGWSMIIIMNIHFIIVCLWLAFLMGDVIRVLYIKISAIVKVYCVQKFGLRVGRDYKNKFELSTDTRKVQQMMMLEENIHNNRVLFEHLPDPINGPLQDPKVANNMPHTIDPGRRNPGNMDTQINLDMLFQSQMKDLIDSQEPNTPRFEVSKLPKRTSPVSNVRVTPQFARNAKSKLSESRENVELDDLEARLARAFKESVLPQHKLSQINGTQEFFQTELENLQNGGNRRTEETKEANTTQPKRKLHAPGLKKYF